MVCAAMILVTPSAGGIVTRLTGFLPPPIVFSDQQPVVLLH